MQASVAFLISAANFAPLLYEEVDDLGVLRPHSAEQGGVPVLAAVLQVGVGSQQ